MKKRLGDVLLERRLISPDQLNSALGHQKQWGMRLGTALVTKGFIAEGTLMRVLSESLAIPMVDLSKVAVDPAALALLPARICEQYEIFPLTVKEQKGARRALLIAMADPLNMAAIDEIAFMSGCTVSTSIAQISSIDHAIQRYYHGQQREIAPLNFGADAVAGGRDVEEKTNPGTRAPRSTSQGPAEPFMDFSDEGATEPPSPVVVGISVVDNQTLPPEHPMAGQPAGAFSIAISGEGEPVLDLDVEAEVKPVSLEAVQASEQKFWALMKVLTRRGLLTKDELISELANPEKPQ